MCPKIKICCISDFREAQLAMEAGAWALGLVGPMPSGPGVISNADIARIREKVGGRAKTFLLSSETEAQAIFQHHQITGTSTIQLVDKPSPGAYSRLRELLPGVELVQVIHVSDDSAVEEALRAAEKVDYLLLDSGNPKLPIKVLGGTGKTHNWSISRRIVAQSSKPVFLAGGLNPGNAARALDEVQPFGLDVCSGLRTAGRLDLQKVEAFFRVVDQ